MKGGERQVIGIKKEEKGKEPQEAKRKIEITGKAGELGKELKMEYVSRTMKVHYW